MSTEMKPRNIVIGCSFIIAKGGCQLLPVGSLVIFPSERTIPADGRRLKISDFPELYQVVGDCYCPKIITREWPLPTWKKRANNVIKMFRPRREMAPNPDYLEGFFRVPDMRGEFFS